MGLKNTFAFAIVFPRSHPPFAFHPIGFPFSLPCLSSCSPFPSFSFLFLFMNSCVSLLWWFPLGFVQLFWQKLYPFFPLFPSPTFFSVLFFLRVRRLLHEVPTPPISELSTAVFFSAVFFFQIPLPLLTETCFQERLFLSLVAGFFAPFS